MDMHSSTSSDASSASSASSSLGSSHLFSSVDSSSCSGIMSLSFDDSSISSASTAESNDAYNRIKNLCHLYRSKPSSEKFILDRLDEILAEDPEVVYTRNDHDQTILHLAAEKSGVEFCKRLVQSKGGRDAVRTRTPWPDCRYPFHHAVKNGNTDVAIYLHSIHPSAQGVSFGLIHCLANADDKLIRFLISHDTHRQLTTATNCQHGTHFLPLHTIVVMEGSLSGTKLLYNAYPMAIFSRCKMNVNQHFTPLELAAHQSDHEKLAFFQTQLKYLQLAQEQQIRPDSHIEAPILQAIRDPQVTEGTVMLMARIDQANVTANDSTGLCPISYALERHDHNRKISDGSFADPLLVWLVLNNPDCLYYRDANGRPLLHILLACNEEITVSCLLEANVLNSSFYDVFALQDASGDTILHYMCRMGQLSALSRYLVMSQHGVSMRGKDGKLPIESLLYEANCDRSDSWYCRCVYYLFRYYTTGLKLR